MADLLTQRFNWKFNRALAAPFYTNSYQQDYPQPAQPGGIIAWGEDCDQVDINQVTIPLPLWPVTWRKQLSRISTNQSPSQPGNWQICWMYNSTLSLGSWPGAGKVFAPLVTTGQIQQNPLMSMRDANGNILIVTTFGTTGLAAPLAAVNAAEGVTVTDGTVVWTVVSGNSQGFRLGSLPNSTGPVFQILPSYQIEPPTITALSQLLNPFPDSYIHHFERALEYQCRISGPDPQRREMALKEYPLWLKELASTMVQGDKEPEVYGLLPATSPVDNGRGGGILTANNPFGV